MKHLDEYGGRLPEPVRTPHVHELRGRRVMLDVELAPILGLPVRELRRQARRARARLRDGWIVTLTAVEKRALGIRARDRALAVTESGLVALAMALRTPRAAEWSVAIVRRLFESAEASGAGAIDLLAAILPEITGAGGRAD